MAEILEVGNSLNWKKTVICGSCQCQFIVTVDDIVERVYRGPDTTVIVKCPISKTCGLRNIITVPKHVAEQFRKKNGR